MITKQQWNGFLRHIQKCLNLGVILHIHNHRVNHILDGVIYCTTSRSLEWYTLRHPDSLDDYKKLHDIYQAVKINCTLEHFKDILKKK